jgi:hypothetical protein
VVLVALAENKAKLGDFSSLSSHSSPGSLHMDEIYVKTLPEGNYLTLEIVFRVLTYLGIGLELDESGVMMGLTTYGDPEQSSHSPRGHVSTWSPLKYRDYADEPIHEASKVFAAHPDHRHHILEHMQEVATAIRGMEDQSNRLLEDQNLTQREAETIAEKIDEEIHALQYKVSD